MNEREVIWKTIRKRRKKLIGHMTRNYNWITTIIETKIHGRGRRSTPFMIQIIENLGRN